MLHSSLNPVHQPVIVANGYNLNVTDRAKKRLQSINDESGEWLRVGVENGGCHGYQYNLSLVPHKTTDKETGKKHEFVDNVPDVSFKVTPSVTILVDEPSMKILNNTTLEYTQELIGSSFQITGGNLKSKCGCGTSFDLDAEQT